MAGRALQLLRRRNPFPDSRLQAFLGHPAGKQKCARGQCRVWAGLICPKPSGKLEGRMDANRCTGKKAQGAGSKTVFLSHLDFTFVFSNSKESTFNF